MKSAKKLLLKKETLTGLTSDEMSGLAGGAQTVSDVVRCLSDMIRPCPTDDPRICTGTTGVTSRIIEPCVTDIVC